MDHKHILIDGSGRLNALRQAFVLFFKQ